jgi:hypothetical protein
MCTKRPAAFAAHLLVDDLEVLHPHVDQLLLEAGRVVDHLGDVGVGERREGVRVLLEKGEARRHDGVLLLLEVGVDAPERLHLVGGQAAHGGGDDLAALVRQRLLELRHVDVGLLELGLFGHCGGARASAGVCAAAGAAAPRNRISAKAFFMVLSLRVELSDCRRCRGRRAWGGGSYHGRPR